MKQTILISILFLFSLNTWPLNSAPEKYSSLQQLNIIAQNIIVRGKGQKQLDTWLAQNTVSPEELPCLMDIISSIMQSPSYNDENLLIQLLAYAHQQGADFNTHLEKEELLLHLAVRLNLYNVSNYLLKNGAQPNILNGQFKTALDNLKTHKKISNQLNDLLREHGGQTAEEIAFFYQQTKAPASKEFKYQGESLTLLESKKTSEEGFFWSALQKIKNILKHY